MNNDFYRRHGDFADMPRPLAWLIMSVRDLGLPATVIFVLFYFIFKGQENYVQTQIALTTALKDVAVQMKKIDDNDQLIINNQGLILDRLDGRTKVFHR